MATRTRALSLLWRICLCPRTTLRALALARIELRKAFQQQRSKPIYVSGEWVRSMCRCAPGCWAFFGWCVLPFLGYTVSMSSKGERAYVYVWPISNNMIKKKFAIQVRIYS